MRVDAAIAPGHDIQGRVAADTLYLVADSRGQIELVGLRPVEDTVTKNIIGPEVTAAATPALTAIQFSCITFQQLRGEPLKDIAAGITRGNLIGDAHQPPLQPLFAAGGDTAIDSLHAA